MKLKKGIKAHIKTSILLNLPKLLQIDVYARILTRSIEKGARFKDRELRAQFAPYLNFSLGVCRRQTSLLSKCHSTAGVAGTRSGVSTRWYIVWALGAIHASNPCLHSQEFIIHSNSQTAQSQGYAWNTKALRCLLPSQTTKYHRPSVLPANLRQWCKAAFFFFLILFRNTNACLLLLLPVPKRDALWTIVSESAIASHTVGKHWRNK